MREDEEEEKGKEAAAEDKGSEEDDDDEEAQLARPQYSPGGDGRMDLRTTDLFRGYKLTKYKRYQKR